MSHTGSWEFLGIDRVRKLSYPSIGEGIYLGRNDAHVPRYEVIIKVSSGLGRFSTIMGSRWRSRFRDDCVGRTTNEGIRYLNNIARRSM